jgi:hypothetical protein
MQHFKTSLIVCAVCACVAGSGNAQTAFTPSDGTTVWDGIAADGTKFSYGFDLKKGILFEWYNNHVRILHSFVQSEGCRDPHITTGVHHGHISGSCNSKGNCNSTAGCTYNQWDYLVVTAGAPARNIDVDPEVISTHVAQ